jgi:hypothetical protein
MRINYADAEVRFLADAAKCVRFAAAYGASKETIAKILGKTLTAKGDMMKKNFERYNVLPGQMIHFDQHVPIGLKESSEVMKKLMKVAHRCAFCPEVASHCFQARAGLQKIYLCTEHMVRFFHMKPNRMTPIVRHKPAPMPENAERYYALRRTMDTPITFKGVKLVCHDAGINFGLRYFFSVYQAFSSRDVSTEGFVLSITGIMTPPVSKEGQKLSNRKTIGTHYVQPCQFLEFPAFVAKGIEFMIDEKHCHPGNKIILRTLLESEATIFIEKVGALRSEILAEIAAGEMGG